MKVVDVRAKSSAGLDLSAAGKLFLDLDPRLAIVRGGKVRELPDRARYAEPNGTDLLAGAGAFATLSGWTQSGGSTASIVDGELNIDNNVPPVLTVPGTQSTNEDANKAITGISVADADDASLTVLLSVSHGLISLASTSGITFNSGGQAQASMEITGTKANLNTALGTVTYAPTANYNGADALAITVEDSAGGTDSDSITINVGAINDAPVLTVPGTQSGTEDSAKTVTGISVADVDHSSLTMQLTVTNGVLSLSQTTGLSFSVGDGTSDPTMTFVGNLTNINLALASILVTPTGNFTGAAVLTIVATDAAAGEDTDTVTINFAAVDDAPTLTLTGSTLDYTSGETAVTVDAGLVLADIDSANMVSGYVQITGGYVNGADVLDVTEAYGITKSWNASNGRLTFTGITTKANWQAFLRTVEFYTNGAAGNRTFTFVVNDGTDYSNMPTRTIAVASGEVTPPDAPENMVLSLYAPAPRFGITDSFNAPSAGPTPAGYEIRYANTDVGWESAGVALTDLATAGSHDLLELSHTTLYVVYLAAYVLNGATKVYGTAVSDSITTAANEPPVITVPGDETAEVAVEDGDTEIATFQAEDPETDVVAWSVQSSNIPGGPEFAFNVDGLLTAVPAPPVGEWELVVRGTDTLGAFDEITVAVIVNPQPASGVTVTPLTGSDYETLRAVWAASPSTEVTSYKVYAADTDDVFESATLIDTVAHPTVQYDAIGLSPAVFKKVWIRAVATIAAVDFEAAVSAPGSGSTPALDPPSVAVPATGNAIHYDDSNSVTPGVNESVEGGAPNNPGDWFGITMPESDPAAEVTAELTLTNGYTATLNSEPGLTFLSGADGTSAMTFKGAESNVLAALTDVLVETADSPPTSTEITLTLSNLAGSTGPVSYTLNLNGP